MRIAVPVTNGQLSQHFGHSTGFWVCDAEQNPPTVSNIRELPMPDGGACGIIPAMLSQAGVNVVIAGGIGAGAVQNLQRCGIEAVVGVAPASPQQLAMQYVSGQLSSSGQMCRQDREQHGHGHSPCHRHGTRLDE